MRFGYSFSFSLNSSICSHYHGFLSIRGTNECFWILTVLEIVLTSQHCVQPPVDWIHRLCSFCTLPPGRAPQPSSLIPTCRPCYHHKPLLAWTFSSSRSCHLGRERHALKMWQSLQQPRALPGRHMLRVNFPSALPGSFLAPRTIGKKDSHAWDCACLCSWACYVKYAPWR